MKEKYMKLALIQAQKAFALDETPVGAIIVKDGKVIARAHNLKEKTKNACGHAEILAIQKANKKLNDWRLEGCDMYVTLEPCMMCAGAIIHSRLNKVFIGTLDSKTGAVVSKMKSFDEYIFNHKVMHEEGILQQECESVLKEFFKKLRLRGK